MVVLYLSKNHNIFANTFDDIISFNNLKDSFKRTQKSDSKYNKQSIKYSLDLIANLKQLSKKLKEKTYKPKKYNIFKISKPKKRIIASPQIEDKIVQFAIHNILNTDFERKFIYDSYSCINNKGTHKCAKRTQHFLAKANWMWSKPWILKADIKKYFYSIKHNILKKILKREISDKNTLWLLYKIIDYSPNDIGLPLGNITSQLFANIYLNELDQYIKCKLSKKFYTRYMDDMCFIVKSRKESKKLKKKLSKFINKKLNIKFNKNKTQIFPLKQGVNFTGYKIWHTHILLRKKSKETMKNKLKKIKNLLIENKISFNKVEQILNSWKGHADYACSKNLYKYLENRFSFLDRKEDKFTVREGENI